MPERALRGLLLGAVAALLAAAPATAAGPVVDRVPATMPAAGFRITGCCTFVQPGVSRNLISQAAALRAARKYAGANWQHPGFLLARIVGPVTAGIGTARMRTLRNPTAWLVTFNARKPVHIGIGPGGSGPPMRHFSVALDAKSGDFIRGFYTL
jgi:hypothetical protein